MDCAVIFCVVIIFNYQIIVGVSRPELRRTLSNVLNHPMYSCSDSELSPTALGNGYSPESGSPNLDMRSEPGSFALGGVVDRQASFDSVMSDTGTLRSPRTPTTNHYQPNYVPNYVDIDYSDTSYHPRGARPLLLASRDSDTSLSTVAGTPRLLTSAATSAATSSATATAGTQSEDSSQSMETLRVLVAELQHARSRAESRAETLERQLNSLEDANNLLISDSDEMRRELGKYASETDSWELPENEAIL